MIKNKKVLYSFIALLSILAIPNKTLAYTYTVPIPHTGESNNNDGEDGQRYQSKVLSGVESTSNNKIYTCNYRYNITNSMSITIETYDLQNNKLTANSLTIDEKNRMAAGTSIGIDLYESKSISVSGDFYLTVTSKNRWCTCQRINPNSCKNLLASTTLALKMKMLKIGICIPTIEEKKYNGGCPSGWIEKSCKNEDKTESLTEAGEGNKYYQQCKATLESTIKTALNASTSNPSFQIYLNDSNDYNAENNPEDKNKILDGQKLSEQSIALSTSYSGAGKGNITTIKPQRVTYVYKPNAVCMDVKTSKVRYIMNGNTNKCKNNEILVPDDKVDGKTHWHYFIPLNTKSNEYFTISAQHYKSQEKYIPKICDLIVDNAPTEYQNLMTDGNGNTLNGGSDNQSIEMAKNQFTKTGGCYLQSIIRIPIKQRFYNEVEDDDGNITFKGFNFYYKPIDINNPFPNGINNTSIWYNWSNNDKKTPDLTKSYENITYVAQIKNASEVRKYTQNNSYTSWDNMYTNGVSEFIEKEGVVTRFVDRDSFYKLGCGPSNKDWEECKQ